MKSIITAAVLTVGGASVASAATMYDVFDHNEGGSPEHALWFNNDNSVPANPDGATGTNPNHFLLSNSDSGEGKLIVYDNGEAQLTGTVLNDDGQGFDLVMNLMVDDVNSYDAKGPKGSPDISLWTFFTLVSGTLTSVSSDLHDYVITRLMSPADKDYAVQMGLGANDKDSGFGLSSWIYMQKASCLQPLQVLLVDDDCGELGGDINVSLGVGSELPETPEVPLPLSLALLPVGLGMLGGMKKLKRKAKA